MCQSRTAYGIFACWQGVRAHANKDWVQHYTAEKVKLEIAGQGHHIIPILGVQHAIVVPAYKEEMSTLRETLDVLASHPLASQTYHVCLGMEEREAGSTAKAQSLLELYRSKGAFVDITFSIHPANIIGESAGKSSNVNWATRHMYRRQTMSTLRSIYTVMDADTAFASDFFLASAVHFALAPPATRKRMMFIPPTLFDRNSQDVPIFTRVTDIFWSCAGIGGIYPSSVCKIPTSAYSVSMELARFCDFWDVGPEAIGEDLHFYCKAMFETKGNIHAVTVYSPASQCNVVGKSGQTFASSYLHDMGARWTQATRHMWGSLDFGYCWWRVLTGQFGPSMPKEGYMAINTEAEADSTDEQKVHTDLPTCSRTPSPSVTSMTVDSSSVDDIEIGNRTSSRSRKFTSFEHEDEGDVIFATTLPSIDIRVGSEQSIEEGYLLHEDYTDELDEIDKLRVFPFLVLMSRLYEAHLMVAQVFLLGFLSTIYPSVLYRNGTVALVDPYSRGCTMSECMLSIVESPFAAGVTLPENTPPGLQPSWMMPTILICAAKAAHALAAGGIFATVCMCVMHDCYHHVASSTRWLHSDKIFKEWRVSSDTSKSSPPARYLGARPARSYQRQWPAALLDFAAIPAGLFYGIAPLLYAQLCHLITNRLTYTVSAKSKTIVVLPVTGSSTFLSSSTPQRSAKRVRESLEMCRLPAPHDEHTRRS